MEDKNIIDEQMQQMLASYKQFKKELDKQEAIEKREIFNMLRGRLDSIRSLRNKIFFGGCIAIALPGLIGIEVPLPLDYKIITSAIAFIITAGLGFASMGINGDFVPDIPLVDYARKLKRHKQAQFWWIRITWVLFALWYGLSIGELLVSPIPKWGIVLGIVLVTAIVVALYYFVTRIHSRIIGQYEGVLLRLENPESADWIGE